MPKKTIQHYPKVYLNILSKAIDLGHYEVQCESEKAARSMRATFHAFEAAIRNTKIEEVPLTERLQHEFRVDAANRVMVKVRGDKAVFEDKLVHGHARAMVAALIKDGYGDELPPEALIIQEEMEKGGQGNG